jgi:predicted AAA+ superfamily ATPase
MRKPEGEEYPIGDFLLEEVIGKEDELILAANRWEISHGGFSGRTAAQFIDDVRSRTEHGGEK